MAVGILYRWEDHNHGLGSSHHCEACHKTVELHDKRHREIADLILAIQEIDGVDDAGNPLLDRKKKAKKKNIGSIFDLGLGIEEEKDIQWDDNSSTLYDADLEEKVQRWTAADRKRDRAERKAAKNQVRCAVIRRDVLDRIQDVLHPDIKEALERTSQVPGGQGLVENSTIDANITFNTRTFKWSHLRPTVHEKRIAKANNPRAAPIKTPQEKIKLTNPMLLELGIQIKVVKSSRERQDLVSKLRIAVLEDLDAFENEQAETMQRMAGYWRYVNKRTYNQMVENNQLWDWATGQKLQTVEEKESEAILDDDESPEGSMVGTTPLTSPETCYNHDFTLPEGKTALSLSPLMRERSMLYEAQDPTTPTEQTGTAIIAASDELTDTSKDRVNDLDFHQLSICPTYDPGATLVFRVPSPSSSDDDSYVGDWEDLETPTRATFSGADLLSSPSKPYTSYSPIDRAFDGIKDSRSLTNAVLAHAASPPKKEKPRSRYLLRSTKSPSTIPPGPKDYSNLFNHLDNDTPAPNEEKKEPIAKPPIVSIVISPPELRSLSPELGWQVQRRTKGKKETSPLQTKATKKAHVKKTSGMNYADAAKKAL